MNDRKRKMNMLGELKYMLKNIHIENETEVDPASAATINVIVELCQEKQCKLDPRHFLQLECVMYRAKEHVNTGKWSEIDVRRRIITVISYLRVYSCRNSEISSILENKLHNELCTQLTALKKLKGDSDGDKKSIFLEQAFAGGELGGCKKLLVLITMNPNPENKTIDEGFKIIDNGLLFGKPLHEYPELLHLCAEILKKYYTPEEEKIAYSSGKLNNLPTEIYGASIDELDCPSLDNFSQKYLKKGQPVIIKKCMDHWPAVTLWQDLNYFIKVAGARTVPVEIGAKYTDENWTQKIMTMKDFIHNYIVTDNMDKGYLAQHQLFNQLPELRDDIKEPEYCCLAESDEGVDMNAWFGPKGTVSPLHFDPKQNFLSQVVGEKLVILYRPEDSPNLYPHGDNLSNTSRVNPKNPKFEDFPEFQKAIPYSCILKPGDMLFIPQKWWHYVESRTISFSVSFWWL